MPNNCWHFWTFFWNRIFCEHKNIANFEEAKEKLISIEGWSFVFFLSSVVSCQVVNTTSPLLFCSRNLQQVTQEECLILSFAGHHGHQPPGHSGPGPPSPRPSRPQDRVPVARSASEASHLLHHHLQDEPVRGGRPRGLRRQVRAISSAFLF